MGLWIGIVIGIIIIVLKYLFKDKGEDAVKNKNLHVHLDQNHKNEERAIPNSEPVSSPVLMQKPLAAKKIYSIKTEDFEEFIRQFLLRSNWLRGNDVEDILYSTEPLNVSIDDIRRCAQYFIKDFNRSIFWRIFKSELVVKYRSKTNELCLLIEGRALIKNSSQTNFINEIYTFLKKEVLFYERLSAAEKFERLAVHFGVKVCYSSKEYSYIMNRSQLVLSKKINPANLVEMLEKMDYYWAKSFFNYMVLYALQFDGFLMKSWESSTIHLNIYSLLHELRLLSGRELIKKVKDFGGITCVNVEHDGKEYYVIEFIEERHDYFFKSAQKVLMYNYTNSHPIVNFSRTRTDVLGRLMEI